MKTPVYDDMLDRKVKVSLRFLKELAIAADSGIEAMRLRRKGGREKLVYIARRISDEWEAQGYDVGPKRPVYLDKDES